jgi:hypothetical protein
MLHSLGSIGDGLIPSSIGTQLFIYPVRACN